MNLQVHIQGHHYCNCSRKIDLIISFKKISCFFSTQHKVDWSSTKIYQLQQKIILTCSPVYKNENTKRYVICKSHALEITDTHWYVGNSALWFQSGTVQSSQLHTGLKHQTLPASFNNTRSSSSSVSTTTSPHPQTTSQVHLKE